SRGSVRRENAPKRVETTSVRSTVPVDSGRLELTSQSDRQPAARRRRHKVIPELSEPSPPLRTPSPSAGNAPGARPPPWNPERQGHRTRAVSEAILGQALYTLPDPKNSGIVACPGAHTPSPRTTVTTVRQRIQRSNRRLR